MSIKIAENLYLPYDEIGRFLEKLPNGMIFDVLIHKLPSLKNLKKKEQIQLLNYIRVKGRIDVINTSSKGVSTSPLLKHRMYAANPAHVDQIDKSLPGNVVHSSRAGNVTLPSKVSGTKTPLSQAIKGTIMESKPSPDENKVDTDALRFIHLKDPVLVTAAAKIAEALPKFKSGLTRTELGKEVEQYHRLRGAQRDIVLSYLVGYEKIVFSKVSPAGNPMNAGKYFHPAFIKPLDVSTQRFDHGKPELTLDPIVPLKEKVISEAVKVPESPVVKEVPADDPMPSIEDLIIERLEAGSGRLPMYHLYNYIPRYSELSEAERNEIINSLTSSGEIYQYRDKHPNSDSIVSWIALEGLEEAAQRVVNSTKKVDVPNAFAMAFTRAEQEVKQNQATAPESPALDVTQVVDPVKEKETMSTSPKAMTAAEIRQQILSLEAAAQYLEKEESNAVTLETIKEVRNEIVKQFEISQRALDEQIDAQAALGNAIGKLSALLS